MKNLIFTLILAISNQHTFTMMTAHGDDLTDNNGITYIRSDSHINASNGVIYYQGINSWHGSDGSICNGLGRTFTCL